MKFETKTLHAGIRPDPSTGAIMTPIFQTSTYVQDEPGKHKGFEYARTQNPTRQVLEDNVAALENGKYGIAFGSGLAAMDAVLKTLNPGDEIISTNDLYGGSYRLIKKVYEKFGIVSHFIDLNDLDLFRQTINDKTRLVWIETPTNPVMKIIDLKKVIDASRSKGLLTCVDNTFASPYLQNPLDFGADIVLHSATKYLGGHSDLVMGIIVVKAKELADQFYFIQNASGGVPGPQDCFLCLRGIKTLHVRVDRACENAMKIAQFLSNHPKIAQVNYPGLRDNPFHELATKQMRNFGGMISFVLKDNTIEAANAVLSSTKLFSLAESLGGVESLIGHPATMTHASIPREERLKSGLEDSLIRLSVGIEHIDDLLDDLKIALD